MTLRTRLVLSLVLLVAVVAATLSGIYLLRFSSARLQDVEQRAALLAQQTKTVLLYRVNSVSADRPPPRSFQESKQLWSSIIEKDEELREFLLATVAGSSAVVEILVAGEGGWVLTSSNPARPGTLRPRARELDDFLKLSAFDKLRALYAEGNEFEHTLPLGVSGQSQPVFTIHVVISSVLLRASLEPALRQLGLASLGALLIAAVFAYFYANLAVRPLARIAESLERLLRGEEAAAAPARLYDTAEFSAVQSRLNLLGKQVKGVREDAQVLRGNVEQMLERLEDAVLLFNRDGILLMAAGGAERFFGVSRKQLLNQPAERIFPPETPAGALVRSAIQLRGAVQNRLVALEGPGGVRRRVLVSIEPFEGFARAGILVTLKDAETREQISRQYQLSQRLAALSRLTGGVAHEIKNPLNAINLHLEILKAKLEAHPSGVDQEIEIISRELARLDRVVKGFLDYTKPLELHLAEFPLQTLVAEVARLVEPEAARQNVELEIRQAEAPLWIRGDRDLLQQAVLNVVVNAVEAMPNGGKLTLEVAANDLAALLAVRDTGPGIRDEDLEKIFHLYYSTKKKGSGIGLAITYRIVQVHDAAVEARNAPGGGAEFLFHFPLGAASPREEENALRQDREIRES